MNWTSKKELGLMCALLLLILLSACGVFPAAIGSLIDAVACTIAVLVMMCT